MDITFLNSPNEIKATFSGPITESDGEPLRNAFEKMMQDNHKTVKLDLSLVPIMTSTGIGKLIVFYKRLKGQNRELIIKGIHNNLYDLFTSINLDKMLTIVKNT